MFLLFIELKLMNITGIFYCWWYLIFVASIHLIKKNNNPRKILSAEKKKVKNLSQVILLIFDIHQRRFSSMFKYNSEHKPTQWDIIEQSLDVHM